MRHLRTTIATWLTFSSYTALCAAKPREDSNQPYAYTSSGIVKGVRLNINNRPIDAFYGVPFAEPPLAQLRFRKPLTHPPWKGVYYATRKKPPCAQKSWELTQSFTIDATNSTEDCLHLNIWTAARYCFSPNIGLCGSKAVMVFLHGGGFQFGGNSYSIYDGRYLALLGDVVVVVPNYRLNVFGFLNANVSDNPGNMGMYDQILALKWVQKNIAMFGGDPNRVTLFGQSAGSVSIGYHLLSPLSKGLFKRVIMQSGTPYWKVPDNTFTGKLKVQQLAIGLGCPIGQRGNVLADPGKVIDCIRAKERTEIYRTMKSVFGVEEHYMIPAYYSEFLPFEPVMATEKGLFRDVDLLIGNVMNEGSSIVDHFFWKIFNFKDYTKITVDEIWFYSLLVFQVILGRNPGPIREIYLSDMNQTALALSRLSDAVGDFSLICPSLLYAEAMAKKKNDVYFYVFNHRPSFSVYNQWTGVTHGDELGFVFGFPLLYPRQSTDEEKILSRRLIRIWATFAKTGKPPTVGGQLWPRFTKEHPFYLSINLKNYSQGIGFRQKICDFWRKYLVPSAGS
ncbi:acetylcholinesterase-like [Ornithodoros turicata]|uniref:acetylcholinesterase-like n=1 Tax=Ornithodoros turicata TaxID=34597 RepID=UPI003138EED6